MKRHNISAVFLIIGIILFSAGCQKKEDSFLGKENFETAEGKDILDDTTEQKILTFSLSGYSESRKRNWDLQGDSADILTNNVVLLENVLGHSYNDDSTITLVADKGEFDKTDSNLLLKENVVATTLDGAKLTTDYLNWNASREEVDTDAPVKITRENMQALGCGAFGQPDLKQMQFKKDVTVILEPSTVITCEGALEVDTLNNKAVFNDNVLVVDERGKLWSDKVEVYFDPAEKTVSKVFAKGNVKISRQENITYSEEAAYDASTKMMVLTGRPKLVLYSQEDLNAFTGN